MDELKKITQCTGEGQGSCRRCLDNGKWNRSWMCFLYKIEGMEGCYCSECIKEIQKDSEVYDCGGGGITGMNIFMR